MEMLRTVQNMVIENGTGPVPHWWKRPTIEGFAWGNLSQIVLHKTLYVGFQRDSLGPLPPN